jgi:uncharacterized protein YaaQ
VKALRRATRAKIEFSDVHIRSDGLPLPAPTAVQVGGATIFTFEVESYEEF